MHLNTTLPPYPDGWYVVAFSSELKPGDVLSRRFAGQDIILFRTQSGQPAIIDAYCPHLGAHFGYGGCVVGDAIRCPFHAFTFNTGGDCISTGYNSNPPPKATVRTWPLQETHGLLLVYYAADDQPPDWHIPTLDTEGWLPLITSSWMLNSHPQETSENSVDLGHLMVVHGYENLQILKAPHLDGPYMTARYGMRRPARGMMSTVDTEFTIHLHGLGYSLVEVSIPVMNLQTRQFVLATPEDEGKLRLNIAVSMQKFSADMRQSGILRLLPRVLLNVMMPRLIMDGFTRDVQQDFEIWEHKTYISPPILAEGDGPVGKYRYWTRQFYPQLRGTAS